MRLAEIMTPNVWTTSPERPFAAALEEMHRHDVHHLVVVEGGRVVGVVSTSDGDRTLPATVGDVMHAQVISATTDTTVREAANLMRGHSIGCLPVFDGDQLAGIVTTTDLLELIGRGA